MTKKFTFTQEMADHICERLINKESLQSICDEEGMPSPGTVTNWRKKYPDFDIQYLAARELQAETLFEEMLDIADDGRNDWIEKEGRNGETFIALNSEAMARSRLRIDTRWKMLARMNPKRYGEKTEIDLRSSDGSMSPKDMTDEQKAVKLAAILKRAEAKRAKEVKAAAVDDGSDLV